MTEPKKNKAVRKTEKTGLDRFKEGTDHESAIAAGFRGAHDYYSTLASSKLAYPELSESGEWGTNIELCMQECEDPTEKKLLLQADCLFHRGMRMFFQADRAPTRQIAEQDRGYAIKLLRLHNETALALERYRRKGAQVVQHVHVNQGAQAVCMSGNFKAEAGG